MDINQVILTGRLTDNPVNSVTTTGNSLTKFSIAVNRMKAKDGTQKADFFNIEAWGKTGDFINKYAEKGTSVTLIGRLQQNSYINKDGKNIYSINILVENIKIHSKPKQQEEPKTEKKVDNNYDPFKEFGEQLEYQPDDYLE